MRRSTNLTRIAVSLVAASTVAAFSAVAAPAVSLAAATHATAKATPSVVGHILGSARVAPMSTTDCVATIGIHCYSPLQYRTAYNLNPLYASNITGAGRTIVIVDSFGSPTIQHDLEMFDAQWGLPNTTVQVIAPVGAIPAFDPTDGTMVGWAQETTLDVEYAHAVAPGAHIVLVETPVAETEGVEGFPEMMAAEKYVIDHNIGDVITQSFGATENTFPGYTVGHVPASLQNLRFAFQDAAAHGVTVLASSGDSGVSNVDVDGNDYPTPANSWPSADPLVTSIGGTQMNLNNDGTRAGPDVVWNDGFGAGGGGESNIFSRPLYQIGVHNTVGNFRGTPDISMSAAVDGGAWVYYSFVTPTSPWHIFGGTSEASPIFSGIVALAAQKAGHRLGQINYALYFMGAVSQVAPGLPTGIVDVTSGDISFDGITGPSAGTGYDMASGWGTIDANKFVRALAFLG